MNLNTKLISKDEKRKTILDYAKNIYKLMFLFVFVQGIMLRKRLLNMLEIKPKMEFTLEGENLKTI